MTHTVRRLTLIASIAALAALVAACGETRESTANAGATAPASARTIDVAMEDIKFDQTTLAVKTGEIIQFRFVNDGKVAHDAFIGDLEAQIEHDAEMAEMGGTGGNHMDEAAVVVQPGESGELSYTFSEPGTYQVGCHQPGHYAAGMKIDVTVD